MSDIKLRDLIAAHAYGGMIGSADDYGSSYAEIAKRAYVAADEMLRLRFRQLTIARIKETTAQGYALECGATEGNARLALAGGEGFVTRHCGMTLSGSERRYRVEAFDIDPRNSRRMSAVWLESPLRYDGPFPIGTAVVFQQGALS